MILSASLVVFIGLTLPGLWVLAERIAPLPQSWQALAGGDIMAVIAGLIHLALTLGLIGFQSALAAGAPWGHLAMGGRWPGRFPAALRAGAVVQAGLAALMSAVVAQRAGLIAPVFPVVAIWPVLGLSLLGAVLNLITPSLPERRLWGPVSVAMLACVIATLLA